MKKRVLPLLLAALLCLTGCGSFLQREWYEVKDHSPNSYESNGRDALQADTYQDLVNNILILVGNHTAEGTIWLYYAQEGLAALMQKAGWRGVGYKNLSGGIVAIHRATRPTGPVTGRAAGSPAQPGWEAERPTQETGDPAFPDPA